MNPNEIAKLIATRLLERKAIAKDEAHCINLPEIWDDEGIDPLTKKNLETVFVIAENSFEDIRDAFGKLGADNVMWFYGQLAGHIGDARNEGAQVDNFLRALLSFAYPDETQEQLGQRLGDSVSPRMVNDIYVDDAIDAVPLFEDVFKRWEQRGAGLTDEERARTAELLAYATRMLPYNDVNGSFQSEAETIDAIGMVGAMIEQYERLGNLPESAEVISTFTPIKEKMERYAGEDELFRYPETVARNLYNDMSDVRLQKLASYQGLEQDHFPALD